MEQNKKEELQQLIQDQEKDRKQSYIWNEHIRPSRRVVKPFNAIKNKRKRLAFLGYLAGMSQRQLAKVFRVSQTRIAQWITTGFYWYPTQQLWWHTKKDAEES